MIARYLGDRSILLGIILLAIAAAVLIIASDYALGTTRRMGPGYFPMVLAVLLAGFALALIARGIFGDHDPVDAFAALPAVYILGGAASFGLLLRGGGLLVAIPVMVVVVGFASRQLSFVASLMLAVVLAIGSVVVFVTLLGQPIPVVGDWLRG